MIVLWMVYSMVVAALVGGAALVVDRTTGSVLRQRRWIWASALVLSLGIPLWGALRPPPEVAAGVPARDADRTAGSVVTAPAATPLMARLSELIAQAEPRSLARLDTLLIVGWGLAVGLAFLAYGAANWSLALRRRTWRAAVVDGERVLLAPAVGPAVIGALRPQIVLPEWSIGLPDEQRALMIEHERQHVRAKDPLMLHAAALVALLMPWNLVAWWLNRRLRLAVELDCDARVLANGRDARAYGTLLLDVCSRRQRPTAVLAPALFERTSSLTRRIIAMHPAPARYRRSRLALGAAAAIGVAVLACDMPTPDMLAPDGKDAAPQRLYGKIAGATPVDGVLNLRGIIARHFPEVARGEGGPSILLVVTSGAGDVVYTETQPARDLARVPARRGAAAQAEAPPAMPRPADRARRSSRAEAPIAEMGMVQRRRVEAPGDGRVRLRRSATGRPGLPRGIGAVNPDDIASVDVSKHAAGVLAPSAVSMIFISLKPGAALPPAPALEAR